MQVVPAINAHSFHEARDLIDRAARFLSAGGWMHIDVADGSITPHMLWGNSDEFKSLKISAIKKLHCEVHLMTRDWQTRAVAWRAAGAERIIVPVELLTVEKCAVDIMPSVGPHISADALQPFFGATRQFQILAVPPGSPGQNFQEDALQKIAFVRARAPRATLEVDGGITPAIARRVKDAGADSVVSSSYIWQSADPEKAYQELMMM